MITPTYRGVPIFGSAVRMMSQPITRGGNPGRSSFGTNGLENGDAGGRGGLTSVTGYLQGSGPSGLAVAEALFRSFNDGAEGDLLDSFGVTWPNVSIFLFNPNGRVGQTPAGILYRHYSSTLRHLT